MEAIVYSLINVIKPNMNSLEIIRAGVIHLNKENLSSQNKKTILKTVLYKIAAGNDGIIGTADDRFSKNTIDLINILIDTDLIDDLITKKLI